MTSLTIDILDCPDNLNFLANIGDVVQASLRNFVIHAYNKSRLDLQPVCRPFMSSETSPESIVDIVVVCLASLQTLVRCHADKSSCPANSTTWLQFGWCVRSLPATGMLGRCLSNYTFRTRVEADMEAIYLYYVSRLDRWSDELMF